MMNSIFIVPLLAILAMLAFVAPRATTIALVGACVALPVGVLVWAMLPKLMAPGTPLDACILLAVLAVLSPWYVLPRMGELDKRKAQFGESRSDTARQVMVLSLAIRRRTGCGQGDAMRSAWRLLQGGVTFDCALRSYGSPIAWKTTPHAPLYLPVVRQKFSLTLP